MKQGFYRIRRLTISSYSGRVHKILINKVINRTIITAIDAVVSPKSPYIQREVKMGCCLVKWPHCPFFPDWLFYIFLSFLLPILECGSLPLERKERISILIQWASRAAEVRVSSLCRWSHPHSHYYPHPNLWRLYRKLHWEKHWKPTSKPSESWWQRQWSIENR